MNNLKKIVFLSLLTITVKLNAQTWIPYPTGMSDIVTRVDFVSQDTGFILTVAGLSDIRKTYDGAQTWINCNQPQPTPTWQFDFWNSNLGFACGDSVITRTTDGSNTWTNVFVNSDVSFWNIQVVTANVIYATASLNSTSDTAYLYKSIDAGANWQMVHSRYDIPLPFSPPIHFTSVSTGFMVSNGELLKSTDGGVTWTGFYTNSDFEFPSHLVFANPDTGFVFNEMTTMARTTNTGANWNTIPIPSMSIAFYDAHFFNGKTGLMFGGNGFSSGGIYKTTDSGNSWSLDYSSSNTFYSASFPTPQVGYAGSDNGLIYKYTGANAIAENTSTINFSLFPLPCNSNDLTVAYDLPHPAELTIINTIGQQQTIFNLEAGKHQKKLTLDLLPDGLYYYMLSGNGFAKTGVILISKN